MKLKNLEVLWSLGCCGGKILRCFSVFVDEAWWQHRLLLPEKKQELPSRFFLLLFYLVVYKYILGNQSKSFMLAI